MTDPDRSLQDEFDRHFRGDGPPPDVDDPEAAAYHAVFSALEEEPDGELPNDFAEQVANRVRIGTEPAIAWSDVLLLFLTVAALGATVVLLPSSLELLRESFSGLLRTLDTLATHVRLDVIGAIGLVLAATLGLDGLLKRWRPQRPRAPVPSS